MFIPEALQRIEAELLGEGGMFEVVPEEVLGERMQVLSNRARSLRDGRRSSSLMGAPVEVTTFASSDTSLAVTFRVLASGAVQVNLQPRPASATMLASQAVTVTPSTP